MILITLYPSTRAKNKINDDFPLEVTPSSNNDVFPSNALKIVYIYYLLVLVSTKSVLPSSIGASVISSANAGPAGK